MRKMSRHPLKPLTGVRTPCKFLYMNTTTAAQSATKTMTALVASGMTVEQAAAYLVDRMLAERPSLAAKVFAELAAA